MNNTMKKGGRPRLLNTEKKKYKLPPVRLGTVDYVTVKNRSKQAGLTLTEYQRQIRRLRFRLDLCEPCLRHAKRA